MWNTSLVPIQWVKPQDATKMPQLLCVKLEDPKKITSQALRRSRAVIHLVTAGGRSQAGLNPTWLASASIQSSRSAGAASIRVVNQINITRQ